MKTNAKFVTVWNNGDTVIETNCNYDTDTVFVTDVEVSDIEVSGTLDETRIELTYDDRVETILDFETEDGQTYEDGQVIDDGIEYLDEVKNNS